MLRSLSILYKLYGKPKSSDYITFSAAILPIDSYSGKKFCAIKLNKAIF